MRAESKPSEADRSAHAEMIPFGGREQAALLGPLRTRGDDPCYRSRFVGAVWTAPHTRR